MKHGAVFISFSGTPTIIYVHRGNATRGTDEFQGTSGGFSLPQCHLRPERRFLRAISLPLFVPSRASVPCMEIRLPSDRDECRQGDWSKHEAVLRSFSGTPTIIYVHRGNATRGTDEFQGTSGGFSLPQCHLRPERRFPRALSLPLFVPSRASVLCMEIRLPSDGSTNDEGRSLFGC